MIEKLQLRKENKPSKPNLPHIRPDMKMNSPAPQNSTSTSTTTSTVNEPPIQSTTIPPYPTGHCKKLSPEQLNPPTPSLFVHNEAEVFSPRLQEFCLAHPITVIRNISRVLDLDLGLFSTKTLVEADADHLIEIRTQLQQPSDENWDSDKKRMIWRCESPRNFSKISKYAHYQASTFQEYLVRGEEKKYSPVAVQLSKRRRISSNSIESKDKNNNNNNESQSSDQLSNGYESSTSAISQPSSGYIVSPFHQINSPRDHFDSDLNGLYNEFSNTSTTPSNGIFQKLRKNNQFNLVRFGTNVDLSDPKKWRSQLDELEKLPAFARVVSAPNMLSHVGHSILGMNTVQLYMKVPGCRTPGHQENNNFCSVNINIGPGDCEWFGVQEEYWGPIAKLCAENGTNFVHGSWWPNLDELYELNIPVYRFIQKPGDLVWVNTGTVHWVQAIGWCNNIAWNVGPITGKQFRSAIERYEWNKVERYKSIVPMIHLTWNLIRKIDIHDEELFLMMKNFTRQTLDYSERLLKMLKDSNIEVKWHGKADQEAAHYCGHCELEVFNVLFVRSIEKKLVVHCAKCAIKISQVLENFVVLQEYDTNYLRETYANFVKSFETRRRRAVSLTNSPLLN